MSNEIFDLIYQRRIDYPTQRALPDDSDPPAGHSKSLYLSPVPFDVIIELVLPELWPGRRGGSLRASKMTVPEAAMNEQESPVAREY